ncbi:5-oxoprolinase subunit PxpB [Pontibacillus litoralis]|uniref:Kinase n=1 Tax=Pontibacillus litoralis JSM 072002 TaxID=1385512 RepID=A0A0A5HTB0_9BACI|nr:5-oxoprolinase subunit PxpB [Pontibacillus litoralis]KGX86867.1 kinase [Pontibacillus litoralis JSM 072002]
MYFHLSPLGDHAIVIELGDDINETVHRNVQCVSHAIEQQSFEWLIEHIPAFTKVTVLYDPMKTPYVNAHESPYEIVSKQLIRLLRTVKGSKVTRSRTVEIPVCYGGEYGPDLAYVAKVNHLTEEEVVHIHSQGTYTVYMIGFAPGFPYVGGMSERIATPRKQSPRLEIPAGSVGIAGKQTGVYPIATPGGWQLIGQTPLSLFDPNSTSPTLLQAGDTIVFKPITRQAYESYKEEK